MAAKKWDISIELNVGDAPDEQTAETWRILEGEGEEVLDASRTPDGGLLIRLRVEASTPYIAFHLGESAVARAAGAAGLIGTLAAFSVAPAR